MTRNFDITTTWKNDPRWSGIERPYTAQDVDRLRGTIHIEHSLARHGAERLWQQMQSEPYVNALGAMTGNQAMQMVQAGLQAIYVSGWQVAGDANTAGQIYPDQSLYPCDSVPNLVRRINNALLRADQIWHQEGRNGIDWVVPLVADAEAGFGGNLNAFELMKAMIEAGAAGVHFEDQLSSAKKCGHMGGKVLVSTQEAIQKLVAARLAADVCGVPTILIARTELLPHQEWTRYRHCPRAGLCPLRGHDLVRNQRAKPPRGPALCRGHSCQIPRENAGLQLFAVVQLEEETR